MSKTFKTWVPAILSGSCLVLLSLVLKFYQGAEAWETLPWVTMLPFALLVVSALLGVVFAQTRISYLALFLGSILFCLDRCGSHAGPDVEEKMAVMVLLSSILVPVMASVFYFMHEQGFLTPQGHVRTIMALSMIVLVVLVPLSEPLRNLLTGIDSPWLRSVSGWLALPGAGLVVLGACLLFLLLVPNSVESPRLGTLLAIAILFVFAGLNLGSEWWAVRVRRTALFLHIAGAGVVLVVAVLESSWRVAHLDHLTELPGRRVMERHIAQLGSSYSLAVVDIDHFKKINDRYGHETGDQTLRFLAALLKGSKVGKAYRYGGEEFVLVSESDDVNQVASDADELRAEINEHPFWVRSSDRPRKRPKTPSMARNPEQKIRISVSIGVAKCGERFLTADEVFHAADKALYRAKKAGRNQVKTARG